MMQNSLTARAVPLSKLWLDAPGWINPREFSGLEDDDIAKLGQSIKDKGIVDPFKVAQVKINGDVIDLVIDGQRRYKAAVHVLAKNAPIPVIDLVEEPIELTEDNIDMLLEKAFTTLEREDLSSFELASAAERWKARGKTGEWIAKRIDRSPSWVSKMLKAKAAAKPKLLLAWRKGEVTDEQFKELAEVKDADEQTQKAAEVVQIRKGGDKTEARVKAKEVKETARVANGHAKNGHGKPTVPPAVAGGQMTFDGTEDKPAPDTDVHFSRAKGPAPEKPKPEHKAPSKLALQELVDVAAKRPPTADYVKGLVDGVRYALGIIDPGDFSKAWTQYLARVDGSGAAKKAAKAFKKAKPSTAKRIAKAAKKGGKSKGFTKAVVAADKQAGIKPAKRKAAKKGKR